MAFYLNTEPNSINFPNRVDSQTVNIGTNGTLIVDSFPEWLSVSIQTLNFKAFDEVSGQRNTDVINAFDTGDSFAAKSAVEYAPTTFPGITGWYLPSVDQMVTITTNQNILVGAPLTASNYWSSTEDSTVQGTRAVSVAASNNAVSNTDKSTQYAVRPVREVIYTESVAPYPVGQDLSYGIVYEIDAQNKVMHIVSKEDLSPVVWGTILTVANADFASTITLSTLSNPSSKDRRGIVSISLQEDTSISSDIAIVQLASAIVVTSPDVPQTTTSFDKVLLSDIVKNVMVYTQNERAYDFGMTQYEAVLFGKRLIQEFGYNGTNDLKYYEGNITDANKLIPPLDFVDYVAMFLPTEEGFLIPLFYNNNLNVSFQFVEDENGNIITDDEGYPIKAQGTRRSDDTITNNPVRQYYDGYYNGSNRVYAYRGLPGLTGGQRSYSGTYHYDKDAGEFLLDGIPTNFETAVLAYLSDPVLSERNPSRIAINKFFQNAIEKGIYYYFIERLRDVPSFEKARARKEYYNEFRIAKRRAKVKGLEIIQKLASDIGFNKTL